MQKFFCAIGFLSLVLIFQDCLVPVESVRVRVVKVKRQDSHYAKRQVSRNPYTDVPLAGDPDAESFPVNTNNLRPDDNPYNAGNRPADYPLNNNIPYDDQNRGTSTASNNPDRYYPGSNNNNNNNNNNYGDRNFNNNNDNNRQPSSTGQQQGGGGIIPSSSPQKAKDKGEDCPGCGHSIPGEAGVDYPNYNSPPKTSFSCSNQQWSGYYADVEARCQVFWICQKNRADAFLCPNGTIFNQQVFVCDWWFNSDCNTAADYYSRNQYLYAGPTVDLFGNTITPYVAPTGNTPQQRPVRLQAAPPADSEQSPSRPAVVTPQQQKRPAPQVVAKQPAPQRQVVTQAPRRQQPAPQRQPQQTPVRQQQQQPQRQTVTNAAPSGGYGSSTSGYTTPVSNRRNDDYPAPTNPPTYIRTAQQQQKPTDYRNDRLKQGQNSYPVPGNSLAAVDGDFGLKMNNIKAAVEFAEPARQTQYDRADEERRYKNNNNNNNIDRAEQERQAGKNKPNNRNPGNNNNYPVSKPAVGYPSGNNNQGGYSSPNSNRGGYSNNNQGYTSNAPVSGGYSTSSSASAAYTAQTETPIARRVGNAPDQLPRQPLYSSGSKQFEPVIGYGQKLRSNLKSVAPVSDYVEDQQEAGSFSSEVPSVAQLYSSTTKRNALDDYDSENTTPYTLSHDDEDLVATVSTLRYGETAAKPSVYSTEVEVPVNSGSSETTTTPAPLTFGQKLTRAAKKRNTSNWGNWRTMLLGDI